MIPTNQSFCNSRSWESGQDVSSRFGPQQTGGTIIEHVRPVDLQASMAQAAQIMARWASLLAQEGAPATAVETPQDFSSETQWWQKVADEFTVKTRQMWQDGWFRDYDAQTREWSEQQDTMLLAPVFCGAAGWGHIEQLRSSFSRPPIHSGWMPLSWPPVVMTLVGAASVAQMPLEAAELAYAFIDASYRSTDSRELDEHGGLPGVTREYRQPVTVGKWGETTYTNAGIEGYGWGALSIHLLIRYLVGLREEEANLITIAPFLPPPLRRAGAIYSIAPLPWGSYTLSITCTIRDAQGYTLHLRCSLPESTSTAEALAVGGGPELTAQECQWEGQWGEQRTLTLPQLTISSVNQM